MNKDIIFSKTAIIYASQGSVWNVLLSGELYQNAWGAKVETTWKEGAEIQLSGVWDNVSYTDKGRVLANKPNTLLKYSYWSSFWNAADVPEEYCIISFRINSFDEMTSEVVIMQEGFRDEKHYTETVELLAKTLEVVKYSAEKLDLMDRCKNSFDKLTSLLDDVQQDKYNTPVPNGWSIAQVVEHLIMSSAGVRQFFSDASFSSDRYDANIPEIRSMMLNTEKKLVTIDALVPPVKTYDRQEHMDFVFTIREELEDSIMKFDLDRRVDSFPMPPFGTMSIFEWLTFIVFHGSRHTLQIERML